MALLQFASNYLSHRLKATNRHGIHSPFVYKLVDEVIYDFIPKIEYTEIEKLRNQLLADERTISITDLGAGSHLNNNKQKKVKEIAKNALKSKKIAQLLYRLTTHFNPITCIELGTCLGITTSYFAKSIPHSKIISIEGCPNTAKIARENLQKLAINNVSIYTGNFDELLPEIIKKEQCLDFVFVDGNHRKDATLNYFEWCLPKIHENSVLIFDDIYWSKEMKEAWKQIKSHPQVSVTVDLFWIGLVFFKKGQVKEDFKIKF